MSSLNEGWPFSAVIPVPPGAPVLDLSGRKMRVSDAEIAALSFAIGKYDEKREGAYDSELFSDGRDVHMGIDLFARAGTEIHSFAAGKILCWAYHSKELDYGATLVLEYRIQELALYALYGHLSMRSIEGWTVGQPIEQGQRIAWVGERHENGGWVPHLHFQLSYKKPANADLPGVVHERDRAHSRLIYPDPRLVLGPIY